MPGRAVTGIVGQKTAGQGLGAADIIRLRREFRGPRGQAEAERKTGPGMIRMIA